MSEAANLSRPDRQARSAARLAAVQALYQLEVAGAGVETVVREFGDHRFGRDIEGQKAADVDEVFFGDIVRGVVREQAPIDAVIRRRLAKTWKLERLDSTVRALLRCAAFELRDRDDVPTEVVIDEYVELAKAFVTKKEVGFVNGALDGVARDVRAD